MVRAIWGRARKGLRSAGAKGSCGAFKGGGGKGKRRRGDGAARLVECFRCRVFAARIYLRSTKICWQSAAPVFSAECDGITGTALAVPAFRDISDVLPSGVYIFVEQSVML
jgi:hypothetical protein